MITERSTLKSALPLDFLLNKPGESLLVLDFVFRLLFGSSKARGRIGATAAGLATATTTPDSSLLLLPTPQLTATPDP